MAGFNDRWTLQRAARAALDVQNACNLSGVLRTFVKAQEAVFDSCNSTEERNVHPITRVFMSKLASLARMECHSYSEVDDHRMWDEVERLANVPDPYVCEDCGEPLSDLAPRCDCMDEG